MKPELTSEQILERKDKIKKLIAQWQEEGKQMGVVRLLKLDTSKIKEDEIEITLAQRQNLRIAFEGGKWGPEVLTEELVFNTVATCDPNCSIEGDLYFLKKTMDRLDAIFIERREAIIYRVLTSV